MKTTRFTRRQLLKVGALAAGSLALTKVNLASATRRTSVVPPLEVGPVFWSVVSPIQSAATTDGTTHVQYELLITNEAHIPVTLTTIEALDAKTRQPAGVSRAFSSAGTNVVGKVRLLSAGAGDGDAIYSNQLAPGASGILYADLAFPTLRDVPTRILHHIVTTAEVGGTSTTFDVVDNGYDINRAEPVVIAPPVKGDRWFIANGAGTILSPHRFTTQPANGVLWVPEHYAIDFIQLDDKYAPFNGDPSDVKSYPYYGADILSVGRGRVTEISDGLPDGVPGARNPPLKADQYVGNHVIVDMGNGHSALYAHLAPGSVSVRVGETVRTGQVVGKLGNTGNSDAPHLHFQIMATPTALSTYGQPFVFDRMVYQGRAVGSLDSMGDTIFAGQQGTIDTTNTGSRRRQMPLTLDIIAL